VVEVLSPWNKRPGDGRDDFVERRGRILRSSTNLVEIDLLRSGPRLPAFGAPEGSAYSILLSAAARRPHGLLLPFGVRDPIPNFSLPLRPEDAEPEVDLKALVDEFYDTTRVAVRIDYTRPPDPPLNPEDEKWADRMLGERGRRQPAL
jgi:hypothetical protein